MNSEDKTDETLADGSELNKIAETEHAYLHQRFARRARSRAH